MNVFRGTNALKDFYDPEKCPPLPLVELPDHPFQNDGVEIFAKMLTLLPAANVKSLPALNMLLRAVESGEINEHTKRIIEWSSGNTAISLAIISRIYGLGDVSAYISNKNSEAKMQLLRFFGLELSLFGGPAQVNPDDLDGGIHAAISDGAKEGCYNPSQYTSARNPEAHIRWTGPQLYKQLPDISVFAAGLGTAGTITGIGTYLKSVNPRIINVGVFTAPGDKVPGPRPIDLAPPPAEMDLPWKDVIDEAEFASSLDSYQASVDLCRQGLLVGPSSGLALTGLYHFLEKAKANGALDKLRGPDGKIKCAFICCDQPFQYIGEYFEKLPLNLFPKIVNEELIGVDQYPYGSSWTISREEACQKISAAPSDRATVLDLRDSADFNAVRIAGSINFDLHGRDEPNPFTSPPVLRRQWLEFDHRLCADDPEFGPKLFGRIVVINSYSGHSAVVASSVLRKKGVEAYAVQDGFDFAGEPSQYAPVSTADQVQPKMDAFSNTGVRQ
ncbi:tryptophan synthase beta subunit-like PLP-dependent enzyme [Mycena rosella]|uniref:Tryptophan synthase beta subunit-like PLP-dependent enzyme n=1 Tax=Mycena rosella TaxID=1033263 RepID=A0AAD7D844_MYCRO|nr:tryptophan synthase beta subunit-like PLP-dependent enzyme [Mycena rosella]